MILGVDHVALSCNDLVVGTSILEPAGFASVFVQRELQNHPAKRPLLQVYEPLHSVAYCKPKAGVALELTQHAQPLHRTMSSYQVLFSRQPVLGVPFEDAFETVYEPAWQAVGCDRAVPGFWPGLCAQFWYDPDGDTTDPVSISGLLLEVTDLAASSNFWTEGLGCRTVSHGDSWMRVAFRSPVAAWSLDVILVETGRVAVAQPFLDAPGFPCLALISYRLEADVDAALRCGGRDAIDVFELNVNGKPLKVVVFRGPDGELVELIEISKL